MVLGFISHSNNEPPIRSYEINYGHSKSFKGYTCTEDCSGHEADYEWAENKKIYDKNDCSTKSNSFNEGCLSYIEDLN
jgi:hypothetical protein